MKKALQPWRLIRTDLFCSALALLLAALAVVFAAQYYWKQEGDQQQKQNELKDLRQQAEIQRRTWQDAGNYQALYQQLSDRGLINTEHRLDWIEYLTALNQSNPALKLTFSFDSQRPLAAKSGSAQLYASKMKLSFQPRHEDELSSVLAGIRRLPGWPALGDCVIKRDRTTSMLLNVVCNVEWLSIGAVSQGGQP